jgi:hypothetical protein
MKETVKAENVIQFHQTLKTEYHKDTRGKKKLSSSNLLISEIYFG